MKKTSILLSGIFSALVLSLSVSCTKDLDALPLNPTDFTSETVYGTEIDNYLSAVAKVYHTMYDCNAVSNVGNGSHASFLIGYWLLGECSTDTAKGAWINDTWTHYVNYNTWKTEHLDPTYGLYANCLLGATYVNEFLNQSTDEKLDSRGVSAEVKSHVHSLRAEARIIRAFDYTILIDVFGNIPFVDESHPIGKTAPKMMQRKEAFDWLVTELTELAESSDTPAAHSNYPRVDKGTALGLLARLYLNAEVYTGTPMWAETKTTCEKIFSLGVYDLCKEYSWLFCGDNGENPEAVKEFIFGNYMDSQHTNWNWGGTTMLCAASINVDVIKDGYLTGFGDYWGGLHMPTEFVERFFHPTDVDYTTGAYTIEDKRGQMFYIKGHSADMLPDVYKFEQGWGVNKWSNLPHDKTPEEYADVAKFQYFANTDYVYMRLAEIYLAYAEACLKLGRESEGLPYVNKLRTRAGVDEVASYDSEFLFEEYSRELYWESGRRRDLIRFDKYSSSNYMWKWKGGNYDGQSFPKYMEIFAIPVSELQANENLVQNPGYDDK